ncbi:hypothetical protein [Flavobacterium weaverense]|jgi:hypothetical protein|uniref:Uncharacterized protein n=1 Tax=Flavobacterium weaverense TaxID=271156 RepID=A0A3L9ZJA6_9FLAO|nr:hypothetical protein [Flavobacterium weaverense]RMA73021.1 hypothetical protein BC961_2618 [Flavobacterium weaverense]
MKKVTVGELSVSVGVLFTKIEQFESLLGQRYSNTSNRESAIGKGSRFKCASQFNKNEIAQLFYILMDEGILFFDDINEKENRSKMQKFIEDNFTYSGDFGNQVSIGTISKQFSEAKGFTYGDSHLKFLDKIIRVLQKRREKISVK